MRERERERERGTVNDRKLIQNVNLKVQKTAIKMKAIPFLPNQSQLIELQYCFGNSNC